MTINNQQQRKEHKNYVVIWSAFFDSYIVEVLHRIGPRIEIKASGTREECAAWIACQR